MDRHRGWTEGAQCDLILASEGEHGLRQGFSTS